MMGKIGGNQMTNDDKDLKPCPFCGQDSAICNQDDNGLWYVYCNNDFCFAEITEVTSQEAVIEKWNTRPTPQQPSEPLKELDDFQEINFNNYNEDDVRALQYWAFKAYEIIKSKFVQPSEKKALSVKSIKKEILKQWNEYDRMNVQMDSHEEAERLAQAIHSAMPAQREVRYPEKINHKASCQCFYDKEMPCSCGADERNQTIDEFKKLNS